MGVCGFEIPKLAEKYLEENFQVAGADATALHIPQFQPLPLVGMVAFAEEGNGDQRTLYWPEESDSEQPIALSTSHDVYGFIPEASSFEAMLRLRWATLDPEDEEEAEEMESIAELVGELKPFAGGQNFRSALKIDPDSPFLLTAVADLEQQADNLEAALLDYGKALQHFPAYTAARSGLVKVLNKMSRIDEAVGHSLEVIISPLQLDGRTFWSNFNLPLSRQNTHEKTARSLKRRKSPPELSGHLQVVWDLRQEFDFDGEPPNWQALAKLSEQLQAAGHLRQAIRVHQGLAPLLTYCLNDFDQDRYYRKQLELYQELGDERRATYIKEKLGD
jgi:tetratricopeptide (TPR) repeat protein